MSDWSGYHVSAFVLHVREGMTDEYRRRHAAIWPELAAALKAQGIVHYDLFLDEAGRRVFGHQLRSRQRSRPTGILASDCSSGFHPGTDARIHGTDSHDEGRHDHDGAR